MKFAKQPKLLIFYNVADFSRHLPVFYKENSCRGFRRLAAQVCKLVQWCITLTALFIFSWPRISLRTLYDTQMINCSGIARKLGSHISKPNNNQNEEFYTAKLVWESINNCLQTLTHYTSKKAHSNNDWNSLRNSSPLRILYSKWSTVCNPINSIFTVAKFLTIVPSSKECLRSKLEVIWVPNVPGKPVSQITTSFRRKNLKLQHQKKLIHNPRNIG